MDKKEGKKGKGELYFSDILDKYEVRKVTSLKKENRFVSLVEVGEQKFVIKSMELKGDNDKIMANDELQFALKYGEKGISPKVIDVRKEFVIDNKKYYEILFEYGGVDLLKIMEEIIKNGGPFPVEMYQQWVTQSINIMMILHEDKVNFVDFKPDNFVWDKKLLIIDFGSAKNKYEDLKSTAATSTSLLITQRYAPPEALGGNASIGLKRIPSKLDVYCWGAAFLYLLLAPHVKTLDEFLNGSAMAESWKKFAVELKVEPKIDSIFTFMRCANSTSNGNVFLTDVITKLPCTPGFSLLETLEIKLMITSAMEFKPEDRPEFEDLLRKRNCFKQIGNKE